MTPTAARRRRHALAAVVVITTATLALAGCSPQGAEAQVRQIAADYLQALEDGDAETALAFTDVAAHDLTCPDLARNVVYETVADRPAGAEVTAVSVVEPTFGTRGSASVEVSYDVGGSRETDTLTFVLDGDGSGDDDWAIDGEEGGLVPSAVDLSFDGQGTVALNGTCLARRDEVGNVRAFPGTYEVTFDDPAGIGEAGPFDHVVPGEPVDLGPAARPEVVEQVEEQLLAWIDACTEQPLADPTCPVGVDRLSGGIEVTSAGELEDLAITLAPDSAGWMYRLTAYRSMQGTILPDACVGLGRPTCTPGGPASDYISFGSWGRVALDDDGAVVLTRVGRF